MNVPFAGKWLAAVANSHAGELTFEIGQWLCHQEAELFDADESSETVGVDCRTQIRRHARNIGIVKRIEAARSGQNAGKQAQQVHLQLLSEARDSR